MLYSSGILDELSEDENLMGDKKYSSVQGVVTQYEVGIRQFNEFNNYRATIEHVNSEIKNFKSMSGTWRQSHEKHKMAFYFICNVINLRRYCKFE